MHAFLTASLPYPDFITMKKHFQTITACALLASLAAPCILGCDGHKGGLATDSGEMTLEQYEAEVAKSTGAMEEMPANANQPAR